ncbi:MAG: cupin domain-containing protein [Clostridia bacterium]|jgi:quercetin dioxygenase-like cupin family protein|nr:cupin domain-containing protein [Clostridia bacterium]
MIKKAGTIKKLEMKNAQGGNNSIFAEPILTGDEFTNSGRLYNKMTFPPKASIGYHVHKGESETYFILKGTGMYSDNGKEVEVHAGDIAYCAPGEGHGLENIGDEDLIMIALIIFDKR